MTVGESRLPWAPYHGKRAGVKLHVGLLEATQMPHNVVETTGLRHDSSVMDEFLDLRFILVAERAYFQIKRVDDFYEAGQSFVIRVKMNVEVSQKRSLRRVKEPDSNVTGDFTCCLGTLQNRSKHRHRVIEFMDRNGNAMRVVTNLRTVSAEKIAAMYQARWTIEVFFRWVKQHLHVPTLFGTTENAVFNQLYAALLAYILLNVLYESGKHQPSLQVISLIQFTRQLMEDKLCAEWRMCFQAFFKQCQRLYGSSLSETG